MNPFDLPVEKIEELVAQHGTPLYLVSEQKIRENFRLLDRCLPAVNLFYAMKANPHQGILEILKKEGAGFDVASRGEFLAAIAAGSLGLRASNTSVTLGKPPVMSWVPPEALG